MAKSVELTKEQEAQIAKLTDTIEYLESKIKAKLVNSEDKERYKKVIKIAKATIKQIKTDAKQTNKESS